LIDIDSIFGKKRNLDLNVDFFVTGSIQLPVSRAYKFFSLYSTTIPEVLSWFVNKNHGCDNGGNNINL